MHVSVNTLKNFINVLGIAMNGDMVITRKPNENIIASVTNTEKRVMITAFIANGKQVEYDVDESVEMCINELDFRKRYLANFDEEYVGVVTTDDLIVLSDDKLTVNVPQIDYEYASRSIPGKSIEDIKSSIPPREIVIAFDADDIQKFIKVAKNLNETIVRFTIPVEGEYINLSTDKRSKLEVHADIDNKYGEEFTVEFDINALEDSFAEAQLDITMGFVTEQTKDQYGNDVLYPVTFDYITGKNTEIDVSGLLIPHKITW
jgi:hypothetical protein